MDLDDVLARDPVAYATVVHDYVAVNPDELSLRQGETVAIVSTDPEELQEAGWWLGRIDARFGFLPANYVEATEAPSPTTPTPEASLSAPPGSASGDNPDAAGNGAEAGGDVPVRVVGSPSSSVLLHEVPYAQLQMGRCIGAGGFSRVYLARFKDRDVAVKQFSEPDRGDPNKASQAKQELIAEGELLASCSHINIAKLYGVCTDGPSLGLVMEYARGGALSSVLQQKSLEPTVILNWAQQICRGMNYLHFECPNISVVHRDLKSSNILLLNALPDGGLLLKGNVLKITDFGLARRFTRTTQVTTAGTFAWMAPEVIRTSTFSKGSDVWSFGVLLWELLTSQTPYHGIHMMTVAYSVALKGCTLPIPSSCPAPFEQLMQDCWRSDPHDRPSFGDILLLLQNAGHSDFVRTPDKDFFDLQEAWRAEMAKKFSELVRTEQEVLGQQHELQRAQAEQASMAKVLEDKERELALRERELEHREAMLVLTTHVRPTPERNATRSKQPFRKKISKDDISQPRGFQHLAHLGQASFPPTEDLPHTASPPDTPTEELPPVRLSPPPPDQWPCPSCGYSNRHDLEECEVCEEANPECVPIPPPRDNPPSKRRGSADSVPEGIAALSTSGATAPAKPARDPAQTGASGAATLPRGHSLHRAGGTGGHASPSSPLTLYSRRAPPGPPAGSPPPSAPPMAAPAGSPPTSPRPKSPNLFRRWSVTAPNRFRRGGHKVAPGGTQRTSPSKKPPAPPLRDRSASTSSIGDDGMLNPPGAKGRHNSAPSKPPAGGKGHSRLRAGTVIGRPFNFQHVQHYAHDGERSLSSPRLPPYSPTTSALTSPPPQRGRVRLPHWLSPGISRREAADALAGQPAGTFLVRASKTQPGSFAICVVQPSGRLQNYLIVRKSKGWRLGDEGRVHFPSIAALVRYFSTIPITASAGGEVCTLRLDSLTPPPDVGATQDVLSPVEQGVAPLLAAAAAAGTVARPPLFTLDPGAVADDYVHGQVAA